MPVSGICGHGVTGSIPVFQTGGAGSFPVVHFRRHGWVAAQLICNQPAAGSSPADGFIDLNKTYGTMNKTFSWWC